MKLRPLVFPLAVLFASSFSPTISGAQAAPPTPRPITVDDYFQVREVDDPQISADGQWVAYTVTTSSLKDDEDKTRIWMVPTAGGDAVAMTSEESSSEHPRWSPDGKYLAFLSKRNEGQDVRLVVESHRRRGPASRQDCAGRQRFRLVAGRQAHRHGAAGSVAGGPRSSRGEDQRRERRQGDQGQESQSAASVGD